MEAERERATIPDGGDGDDDSCPADGMARWTVHLMLVSLNLRDTPLSYTPPRGPSIDFSLNYSQREMNQPMTFGYGNLGPRWNLNWITFLTFDSNSATLHEGSGGSNLFPNFTAASTLSDPEAMTNSRLEKISPGVYHQNFRDGAIRVFSVNDGTRWFLTAGHGSPGQYRDPGLRCAVPPCCHYRRDRPGLHPDLQCPEAHPDHRSLWPDRPVSLRWLGPP